MDNQKPAEDTNSIEAQQLLDFYVDLMENSKHLLKYYLSENVILHWFGRTVKGQKQVATFMNTNIRFMKHGFNKEALATNKISFQDSHSLQTFWPLRRISQPTFFSIPRLTLMFTPIKQLHSSTSAKSHTSQFNLDKSRTKNEGSLSSCPRNLSVSPRKHQRITQLDITDTDVLQSDDNKEADSRVRYLKTEGYVAFHQPNLDKLEREAKWQKSCKIHIAYDFINDINDSSFYLIIYEENNNCRRNLFKDFVEQEPED
ncbi:uncharacterized protein [Euwallacea similis]|uniref:uncharacterized protein n=1 Tax=Euwallacea similis TaxID=1736056 RepID=UPI0034506236